MAKTVIFNHVSYLLIQNNMLDNNQSGFKSSHSTETALLSISVACGQRLTFQGILESHQLTGALGAPQGSMLGPFLFLM